MSAVVIQLRIELTKIAITRNQGKDMKTATITVRVTETTLQQLDAIVNASLLDRSDHVRLALGEYIAQRGGSLPVSVSRLDSHLSTEDEMDFPEPAFDKSPLRGA